jgi:hypothetical protein
MKVRALFINFNYMKVVVIIDTGTREGQEAFNYIKKLKAPEKSITVQKGRNKKIRKLTDEEMALPGPPPSRKELEAWLEEPDDGSIYVGGSEESR